MLLATTYPLGLSYADIGAGLLSGVSGKSGQESATLIRVRRSSRQVITSNLISPIQNKKPAGNHFPAGLLMG